MKFPYKIRSWFLSEFIEWYESTIGNLHDISEGIVVHNVGESDDVILALGQMAIYFNPKNDIIKKSFKKFLRTNIFKFFKKKKRFYKVWLYQNKYGERIALEKSSSDIGVFCFDVFNFIRITNSMIKRSNYGITHIFFTKYEDMPYHSFNKVIVYVQFLNQSDHNLFKLCSPFKKLS